MDWVWIVPYEFLLSKNSEKMLNRTQVISWDGDKITQTASHLPITYLTFRNTPNWTLFKNYDQIVHIFWPHDLSFLLVKPRIMQILMIVYLLYWPLDKFWVQIHFQLSYDFEAIIFIRVWLCTVNRSISALFFFFFCICWCTTRKPFCLLFFSIVHSGQSTNQSLNICVWY